MQAMTNVKVCNKSFHFEGFIQGTIRYTFIVRTYPEELKLESSVQQICLIVL